MMRQALVSVDAHRAWMARGSGGGEDDGADVELPVLDEAAPTSPESSSRRRVRYAPAFHEHQRQRTARFDVVVVQVSEETVHVRYAASDPHAGDPE
jgi:hypothetical protein